MLSLDEQADLATAIVATAETLGQTMSASAAELMAQDLNEYSVQVIAKALQGCRRELTGKLTLAAVLQRIQSTDGRPEANEAWAIALQSYDEVDTVLMTPEIQQAAAAAAPIIAGRDKIGARMAFIAAYERLVADARRAAFPVSWNLSLGHNQERRSLAIQEASRLGRLSAPAAKALLEQHVLPAIAHDGQAIAGLLTGKGPEPSSDLRGKWQAVKSDIEKARRRRDVLRRWNLRKELRALAALKKAAAAAVASAGVDEK